MSWKHFLWIDPPKIQHSLSDDENISNQTPKQESSKCLASELAPNLEPQTIIESKQRGDIDDPDVVVTKVVKYIVGISDRHSVTGKMKHIINFNNPRLFPHTCILYHPQLSQTV